MCTVRFKIGEDVRVDVSKEGRHIRFTIEAPESVTILRDELTKRPATASAGSAPAKPGPVGALAELASLFADRWSTHRGGTGLRCPFAYLPTVYSTVRMSLGESTMI